MKALVVIHAEKTYLHTPRGTINGLVPKIAAAIEENESVYFLAAESEHPLDVKMFPEISAYAAKMHFIPAKTLIAQFLEAKKTLLDDGVESADLAGICYYVCLQDVKKLFSGEGGRFGREQYRTTAEDLGWTPEEFTDVFETKIETRRREELTDKC